MAEFRPALIVVDFQEDFCPPNGSLAIENGRDIADTVNKLLSLPFVIKVATKDWHPQSHVSFAANHKDKKPFSDHVTIVNPQNAEEKYETRLWPVHCVQGTQGAELVPELDIGKVDEIVEKGQNQGVEMYSPFFDPFENPRGSDSGLSGMLKDRGVTDVYVVGLAADYCVLNCAKDAQKEGFRSYIVDEGTRSTDPSNWPKQCRSLRESGVEVVSMKSDEVQKLMTAF